MTLPMHVSLRVPLLIACLCQAQAGEAASVGSPTGALRKGQWVMGLKASGLSRDVTKSDLRAKAELVGGSHFRGYGLRIGSAPTSASAARPSA